MLHIDSKALHYDSREMPECINMLFNGGNEISENAILCVLSKELRLLVAIQNVKL